MRNQNFLIKELRRLGIICYSDASLFPFTTIRVGGNASIIAIIKSSAQLEQTVRIISKANTPFIVIGNGSNLIFSDYGFEGVVIKNESQDWQIIQSDTDFSEFAASPSLHP